MKADRLLVTVQLILYLLNDVLRDLLDANPTKIVGSGGGKGAVTLTDPNPTDAIGSGGGKGVVTLTDGNPSVAIT